MGKARVIEHLGNALYTVQLLRDRRYIERELDLIAQRLERIEENIAAAEEDEEYMELELEEFSMLIGSQLNQLADEGVPQDADLAYLGSLHNAERTSRGLPPLAWSSALTQAAQGHAAWMRSNDIASHTGAGGSSAPQRITAAGYPWATVIGGLAGENVAAGQISPDEVLEGWMGSPGHRANILHADYQHLGLGFACRDDDGKYGTFWCACFGAAPGESVSGSAPPTIPKCDPLSALQEAIQKNLEEMARLSGTLAEIRSRLAGHQGQKLSAEARRRELQSVPADDPVERAWCVDLTEDLAGQEVRSIEPLGEMPLGLLGQSLTRAWLAPGAQSTHVPDRDGWLHYRVGQTPEQAFFNAAILPGVQKWKPLHRLGEITAISDSTCTVALDPAFSTAGPENSSARFNINAASVLTDVPATYMSCDMSAFAVGDRVVVEFTGQDSSSPVVIGFEKEPQPCVPDYVYLDLQRVVHPWVMSGGSDEYHTNLEEDFSTSPCPRVDVRGSPDVIETIDSGRFEITVEYRPLGGYFWMNDGSDEKITASAERILQQDGFTVWSGTQGVCCGYSSEPPKPSGTTLRILDIGNPQFWEVSVSAGGMSVFQDRREPVLNFSASLGYSYFAPDDECTYLGDLVLHANGYSLSATAYALAGGTVVQTTHIDSSNPATILAFLGNVPQTVTATYDGKLVTYTSPEVILDFSIASGMMIRYSLP